MLNRLIGGILLIVGTSIGGGLLALPLATAAGGFWHSAILMLVAWAVMFFSALYIMEANLWFKEDSNLISMAKSTLGWQGAMITWLVYLLLNYSLLSAYISGGSQLFSSLLGLVHINLSNALSGIIFTGVLSIVVAFGVASVDWTNRAFMTIKLLTFILLISLVLPNSNLAYIHEGSTRLLLGATFVIFTSFGFATIVPSLRVYFRSNAKALFIAILIGSFIPLICYLIWIFTVQTAISSLGTDGLIAMAASKNSVAEMTNALGANAKWKMVDSIAHAFSSVCILTSFLGVALSLSDFLADGTGLRKKGKSLVALMLLTFLPPVLVNLFFPGAFIKLLSYAGILCVVLLILLPALMVWSGRYHKKIAQGFAVVGGRFTLVFAMVCGVALLGLGIFYQ